MAQAIAGSRARAIATHAHASIDERLLLCIPQQNRQLGFILAPDGGNLCVEGDSDGGGGVSVRFESAGRVCALRFLDPLNLGWRFVTGPLAAIRIVHKDADPSGDSPTTQPPIRPGSRTISSAPRGKR